jgi:hypothetical protein
VDRFVKIENRFFLSKRTSNNPSNMDQDDDDLFLYGGGDENEGAAVNAGK